VFVQEKTMSEMHSTTAKC